MATRLNELKINEISGVDSPANEVPGWIVAKSAEWQGEIKDFEKAVCGLYDGLSSESADLYFANAPEDISKARVALAEYIGKDVEIDDSPEPDTETPTEAKPEPTRKSIAKRISEVFTGPEPTKAPETDTDAVAEITKDAETETPETPETPDPETPETPETPAETETPTPETDPTVPPAEAPAPPSVEEIADAVSKSLGESIADQVSDQLLDQIADQVEPLREALSSSLDRIESVESYLSGSNALDGQEGLSGSGDEPTTGFSKALGVAMRTGRVELT